MSAAGQTDLTRFWTGRGLSTSFVEFSASADELSAVGGAKGFLGSYQQFIPGTVALEGRAAVFGQMAPNLSQYVIVNNVFVEAPAIGFGHVFDYPGRR
jgi:hypothetical protein